MAQRRRTPWVWLVVAALLLVAGAWLMRGAEPPERPPPPPVTLPVRMKHAEERRAEERRTWLAPATFDAGVALPPQRPRDPVLALMPPQVKTGAVVAEFNAIMNSELGGMMADCLFGDGPFMQELRDAGLDPVTAVDRVAVVDDSVVVTGNFQNAGWKRLLPSDVVAKDYGRQGQLIEGKLPDGGVETFATWGGQMFIAGGTEAEQKAILDRLEGGGAAQPSVLDDSMAFGEVYGVVNASFFSELAGAEDERLGQVIRETAKAVELHMDVSHDVGLVADVNAKDTQKTEELRRSLGSALSLARMQAAAQGKKDEADLLDLATVRSAQGGDSFRLEAGVPHEYMKKMLTRCAERRRAREAERWQEAADAGAP